MVLWLPGLHGSNSTFVMTMHRKVNMWFVTSMHMEGNIPMVSNVHKASETIDSTPKAEGAISGVLSCYADHTAFAASS